MRVTLNKKAFEFAKEMIHQGKFDDKHGRGESAQVKPTDAQEQAYIKSFGWDQFSKWYLGAHLDRPENTRNRYEFPMGDFQTIHRADLLDIQKRAHEHNFDDIANGAKELVDLIDKKTRK